MKVLAVNAGSSSLKFQLLEMPEEKLLCSGLVERIGLLNEGMFKVAYSDKKQVKEHIDIPTHKEAVSLLLNALLELNIISSYEDIEGVGHRVVQGGEAYTKSVKINDKVVKKIEELSDLAPLHNPANLIGINTFREILPNVINVAVFDNAFHSTMKEEAFLYGTPYEWYTSYQIRKYGFHGTSHQYVSSRAAFLLKKRKSNIIVCHLGNGASLCAVKNGVSIDTSMGLTPLEGFPMGTRSGNIDPAIIDYIATKEHKTVSEVLNILNKKSGYVGISGISNDARDLEKASKEGNKRASLAFDIQVKRIVDYIGSYYLYLGGLDAICFTAGIGENSSLIRKMIVDRLKVLKVEIDDNLNSKRGEELLISTPKSKVKVFVIPTNEEVMIARDVYKIGKR